MNVTNNLLSEAFGPPPKAGDKMAINWLMFIDTIAAAIKILFGNCQPNVERKLTAEQAAEHLNWRPILFPVARRRAHLRRIQESMYQAGRDKGLSRDRAFELAAATIEAIEAGKLTAETLDKLYAEHTERQAFNTSYEG